MLPQYLGVQSQQKSEPSLLNKLNSMEGIGLAKKCLQFLSKNKRHVFHFHQELYWTI